LFVVTATARASRDQLQVAEPHLGKNAECNTWSWPGPVSADRFSNGNKLDFREMDKRQILLAHGLPDRMVIRAFAVVWEASKTANH
jgi:hypothetical protein